MIKDVIKKNKYNQKNMYIKEYNKKQKFDNYKLLFSDLETIIEKNEQKVVCLAIVGNGESSIFKSVDEYMKYLIKEQRKSIIYFHNFGRFDSTFILNWIAKNKDVIGSVDVIERNNIIYEVVLKKYKINFRDSYLIINLKLEKIGEHFCEDYKKDDFDYENINKIYIEDPSKLEKLCVNDCLVLEEGFKKYNKLINEYFELDIFSFLTAPSLAFNIFKKHYYNSEKNPISKNPYKEDKFIRDSYVGGIAEVFKPMLKNGYCYDANSLYPFVMKKFKYPVGKGKFVEGDKIDINNFIGFIECEVSIDMELNFLPYRDSKRGLITPVGEWKSVYFHAEVKKAIELGYKIKFIKGFKYEKEDYIFDRYVTELYNIRKNSTNKSMNVIAKLLLNSLYGRFGMKLFLESTKFINHDAVREIGKTHEILNMNYLGNDLYIISCRLKKDMSPEQIFKNTINTEAAVQIASAVTSYARIYMYDFKNIKDNKCYYTDTDSIFLKNKLSNSYIGTDLGQFKLEYEVEKAYFIAPKVYYVSLKNSLSKVVVKGIRKSEMNEEKIIKTFENVILNKSPMVVINRINNFKRDLAKLITYIQTQSLEFTFPFNKRIKLFNSENTWISTRAIKIKKNFYDSKK